MDAVTKEKFTRILLDGKILKCSIADAIETISSNEKLASFNCQKGSLVESLKKGEEVSPNGKVIIKHFFINNRTTEILYWSFCSLNDMLAISGFTDFENGKYNHIAKIKKEDQIGFLGKDIKSAIDHCNNKNIYEEGLNNNYVNTDHPLADNIFYNLRYDYRQDKINCLRNTELSPRPVKNDK